VTCRPLDRLPQADDPFCTEDRLPDSYQLDRYHDDRVRKGDREHQSVFLEIGQRGQRDHQGGYDVAQGYRNEHQVGTQNQDDGTDEVLESDKNATVERGSFLPYKMLEDGPSRRLVRPSDMSEIGGVRLIETDSL
jgi:hypothetical protein